MRHLRQVGLILNATKTKVLTTEAQPPSCLFILGADPIQVLEREGCHKWLGCMLSTATSDAVKADLDFHLQNASKAFWNINGFYATRTFGWLIAWSIFNQWYHL